MKKSEMADSYLRIAEKMHLDLSREEIVKGLQELQEEKKARAEQAAEQVRLELENNGKVSIDEDGLEGAAGGSSAYYACDSTYTDDEWCWFSDACSAIICYYDGSYSGEGRDSEADPRPGDIDYECLGLDDWTELGYE